jgi:HD-GYP domain-containing protein (c-di-GMP phosphodiesterase class II)
VGGRISRVKRHESRARVTRTYARGRSPPMPTPLDHQLDTQQALAQARAREATPLAPRERAVEFVVGGTLVAAAVALAAIGIPKGSFHWDAAAICVVVFAAVSRVEFDVGVAYTRPLQIVFVPMLFLLPPAAVPACVAAALTLAKTPEMLRGRRPIGRVLMATGDAWFAIGPAVVFLAASPGSPDGRDWPIYLAALAAQFAIDSAASFVREGLNGGVSVREQLYEIRWIQLVDTLLAPAGLAFAFAAVGRAWIVLLVLPLAGLMAMFARERAARLQSVLELSRTYRGTALVLGNVVEADDAYTGMHSEGVVDLALAVGDEMGLDPARRRNLEFGALLHDVGKIAVPKEIINKPGPLDDGEWEIMRRHTIEGQRLLDKVGGFMREVGLVVRSSHERYGGGGYPDGLSGEQIPLEARIVSCCDAFSAMTTDRSYRKARSAGAALEELERCAGSQFDPVVVEAVTAVARRRDDRELGVAALLPDPLNAIGHIKASG